MVLKIAALNLNRVNVVLMGPVPFLAGYKVCFFFVFPALGALHPVPKSMLVCFGHFYLLL